MFSGNVDEADACDASGGRCDAVKREKVLPPTLTRPGYYTRPAMVALERYTSEVRTHILWAPYEHPMGILSMSILCDARAMLRRGCHAAAFPVLEKSMLYNPRCA